MDLISVIVPVYQVEKYLDQCVRSIVNQTYTNLEIILVDDGSPDSCPAMCDAWAERDSRIRVIHKKNGGLSDARNAGLDIAKGEYIAFVDSDDWVSSSYIDAMYRAVQETGAGIAACDVSLVPEGTEPTEPPVSEPVLRVVSPEDAISDVLNATGFRAVAWNKLYHRMYLEGMRYPVGKLHEDEFTTYRVLAKAERLVYVDAPLYNYLQRTGSIMHTMSIKRLDALDAFLERIEFLKTQYPTLYLRDKCTCCIACAMFYCTCLCDEQNDKTAFFAKIRACRAQLHFSVGELFRMPPKSLVYVLGTGCCLDLFCRLLNFRRVFLSYILGKR